jgi:pilus assembly protein CpaE
MASRILVIEENEDLRRSLSTTLEAGGYEVMVCSDGLEGVRLWEHGHPSVVIVGATQPGLDGVGVTAKIRAADASGRRTRVVLTTTAADTWQKVRGLRAGADDVLVHPVHPDELLGRVAALLGRASPGGGSRGRVLAFYGAKGGVGTTTVAINAAIALGRELKRKTALVDGKLQFGDHRLFLDFDVDRRSIVDVVQAVAIDEELLRSILVRYASGLDLLLAPPSPEAAELVNGEAHHMATILDRIRAMYEYVVVDLDQRLDDTTLDVIGLADRLFVVMTADLACLKNVRLLLHTLEQLNIPEERVQLVLNRSTAFTGLSAAAAERAVARRIEHKIPNDYRRAIAGLNSGTPVMMGKADCPLGKAVLSFVQQVDGELSAAKPATEGT